MLNKNEFAPIGLSTYSRVAHLKQTVEALQKNTLAGKSELYVFSDAPKPGDEEAVGKVRSFINSIDGFKKITIFERETNDRIFNNRDGMRLLLEKYDKFIYLEEDILTAPGFLAFMNQALDEYEGNDQIFSISGWCPPIKIPEDYRHDVFLLRRFNGWGFGIWKDRFSLLRYMTPDEFDWFAANKKQVKEFVKGGGKDLMGLLKKDAYGTIDAADVKFMYAQFLSDQFTLYPTKSLTQNIGHDGTGIHCGKSHKFDVTLSDKTTFRFPDDPAVDPRIVKANFTFRKDTIYQQARAFVASKTPMLIKHLLRRGLQQL